MISERAHAECTRLLDLLTNERVQENWSHVFMTPVSIPGYEQIIKKPMDLGTVKRYLGKEPAKCRFKSHEKFAKNVRLVFQNAMVYNKADKHVAGSVYNAAQHLLRVFNTAYEKALALGLKDENSSRTTTSSTPEERKERKERKKEKKAKKEKKKKKEHSEHKSSESASNHSISEQETKPTNQSVSQQHRDSTSIPSVQHTSLSTTLSDESLAACHLILNKVIKYKEGNVSPAAPFLQPVDLSLFPDYRIKIPHRMHLYGIQQKLKNHGYASIDMFARDVRRVFSNCLIYNSDVIISKVIRSNALSLMKLFESQFAKIGGKWPGVKPLSNRWKGQSVMDDILGHRTDGQETAQWFKYPIQTYFESNDLVPYGYFQVIKTPMDLGTVSERLHMGEYKDIAMLIKDIELIFENCIRYWKNDAHGQTYCDSAKTLMHHLKTSIAKHLGNLDLIKDEKPSKSGSGTSSTKSTGHNARKERGSSEKWKAACLQIMKELRAHKMKGYKDLEILTAGPFLRPVDVANYPDYLKVISEPMDFSKIERKLKTDRYSSHNEFSADVHLVFSNCFKYNSDPIAGADIRDMASTLQEYFVKLYERKFNSAVGISNATASQTSLENNPRTSDNTPKPNSTPHETYNNEECLKSHAVSTAGTHSHTHSKHESHVHSSHSHKHSHGHNQSHSHSHEVLNDSKKQSALSSSPTDLSLTKKKKKEKKDKKEKKKKDKKEKKRKTKDIQQQNVGASSISGSVPEMNGDLYAASKSSRSVPPPPAKVLPALTKKKSSKKKSSSSSSSKVSSLLSSSAVSLLPWESACERILKRIMRLDIVAELYFDKPLIEVFPDLRDEYARLIPQPMDFRTLTELLHSHALVDEADFYNKGTLIFKNAEKFNYANDAASVHVRMMAQHLTWFFQSLCTELFIQQPRTADKHWKRKERMAILERVPMDLQARECRKMIRVLLTAHKYDKDCWPFRKPVKELFPNISQEYFEVIKKPMDLQTIAEALNYSKYDTYGAFIADVRLTFENALKYNRADKDREGWSVYSAAAAMLKVVDDLWGDVTLEVVEKMKRKSIRLKEQERLAQTINIKDKSSTPTTGNNADEAVYRSKDKLLLKRKRDEAPPKNNTGANTNDGASAENNNASAIPAAQPTSLASGAVVIGTAEASEVKSLNLKLVHTRVTPQMERSMNKSERKAEEKRRKQVKKEEDRAKNEKRRRVEEAAADDALREAQERSRRRQKKYEVERKSKEQEEMQKKRKAEEDEQMMKEKMSFSLHASQWTGKLIPKFTSSKHNGNSFWKHKRQKVELPACFTAISC